MYGQNLTLIGAQIPFVQDSKLKFCALHAEILNIQPLMLMLFNDFPNAPLH